MKNIASVCACLLAGASIGCVPEPSDTDDIPGEAPTGTLVVEMGSQPAEDLDPRVEEVWVRVDSVEIRHEDEGWLDVTDAREDVDLMSGEATVIGGGEVYAGAYDRVEIGITDAWIVVDGMEEELMFLGDVDPNEPLAGGLVITDTFFVDQDSETKIFVDWDLDENLSPRGDGWALGASTRLDVEIGAGGDDPAGEDPAGEDPAGG